MKIRALVLPGAMLLVSCIAAASPVDDTLPPTYLPTGEQTFKQYCAVCHGSDAKGLSQLC